MKRDNDKKRRSGGKNDESISVKRTRVSKMTPKKLETIKTNLPSERVQSNTPQKSMGQVGREMAKSGPRKNVREAVASVKGKLKNTYNRITGGKTVSGEMDGQIFTGYEKGNSRRSVVKVSNPNLGSSKMIDKFDKNGKLKSQQFVDRNTSGKKVQVIKKKY